MAIYIEEEQENIYMQLYIDPGTGSMLFTVLVGILGALIYGLRNFIQKLLFAA